MFQFAFIERYAPLYLAACKLVLTLAFWGILLSTILGFVCALIRYYKVPLLQRLVGTYIELSRNTPLMIHLFFLYFGLSRMGIRLEGETCAIVGLAFLGGSYMAEAFRSGLEAVGRTQIEAGMSVGLNTLQLVRHVILPQAFAVAVPAICANVIFLLKETSVVSIIALPDLMYLAKDLLADPPGMVYHKENILLWLVLAYLIMILPLSLAFSWLEGRVRRAGFGN